MPIVQCQAVTKTYYQNSLTVNALRDVSLEVEEGSFLALAGPSEPIRAAHHGLQPLQ